MLQMPSFELYFAAALVLAITPGPGIFYVLTRTLAGGRRDGILSAGGTLLGGMFHVFAAALGVSAILAASTLAFAVVKYAGAAYLVYLFVRMIRSRDLSFNPAQASLLKPSRTFRQGIATEILNPKTALFFLSLHSAVHSPRARPCVPPVRHSRGYFCGPEHLGGYCGSIRRRRAGRQAEAQHAPDPAAAGGLRSGHDWPGSLRRPGWRRQVG